jgi:hypothetical protein
MKKSKSVFSSRVHIKDEPGNLIIHISGRIPSWQFTLLSGWLLAWSLAGLFVMIELATSTFSSDQRIFMFVWLAFWVWFEYRIFNAWLWRKSGKEVIRFSPECTELSFEINKRGLVRKYDTSLIQQLHNVEVKKGLFTRNFYSSFWVVGGETIGFQCSGAEVTFGRQLSEDESNALIKIIRHKLEQFRKNGQA